MKQMIKKYTEYTFTTESGKVGVKDYEVSVGDYVLPKDDGGFAHTHANYPLAEKIVDVQVKDHFEEVEVPEYFLVKDHSVHMDKWNRLNPSTKSEVLEEARWFLACGRIPVDGIFGCGLLIKEFLTKEEMVKAILSSFALELVFKGSGFITVKYLGSNKGQVIGRRGRVLRQIERFIDTRINLL